MKLLQKCLFISIFILSIIKADDFENEDFAQGVDLEIGIPNHEFKKSIVVNLSDNNEVRIGPLPLAKKVKKKMKKLI